MILNLRDFAFIYDYIVVTRKKNAASLPHSDSEWSVFLYVQSTVYILSDQTNNTRSTGTSGTASRNRQTTKKQNCNIFSPDVLIDHHYSHLCKW
jgi:hypothetical protein